MELIYSRYSAERSCIDFPILLKQMSRYGLLFVGNNEKKDVTSITFHSIGCFSPCSGERFKLYSISDILCLAFRIQQKNGQTNGSVRYIEIHEARALLLAYSPFKSCVGRFNGGS